MSGGELTDYANNLHDVLDWADRIAYDAAGSGHVDPEYERHMMWLARSLYALHDCLHAVDLVMSGDSDDQEAVKAIAEYMKRGMIHCGVTAEDAATLYRCAEDLRDLSLRMYHEAGHQ